MEQETQQDLLFLDALFDGITIRHPDEAKKIAGFPDDYSVIKITKRLQKQILERCEDSLVLHQPQAVMALIQLMQEPETPGLKLKLQTIIEILDRGGITKKEKEEVAKAAPSFMFILPSKADISNT